MAQYKILVSDSMSKEGLAILQAVPEFDVTVKTGMNPAQLAEEIPPYQALVVRSASKVTADVIAAAANLKVIGRAGSGVDNIDVPAATAKGVIVENVPGANANSVAELAIGMMFAISRFIPRGTAGLKDGKWEKKALEGVELTGKTLGVVGFGAIGKLTAGIAKGIGMKLIAFDPFVTNEQAAALGAELADLNVLLARADYVTLHVALNDKTRGLVGAAELARMKKSAFLINCARGGIVDETALAEALTAGIIAGAAFDVFAQEPPAADNPLLKLPNFICTPHIGASTVEAQERVGTLIMEQIRDYLLKGEVRNAVRK